MNKLMTRKIVLLSLVAVFLCIYILQLVFTGRSTIKNITLDATPDTMLVVKGAGEANASNSMRVVFENSMWYVGEKKYPADNVSATKMADSIKNIKLLGILTRSPGSNLDKYGLDDGSKITVTASKDGSSVRTMTIGKNTTSGSQCYVQIDGKDTVYLAEGSLHDTYAVTVDALRSKEIYTTTADGISSVRVELNAGGKSFTVQKVVPKADLSTATVDSTKKDKDADAKTADAGSVQTSWSMAYADNSQPAHALDNEKTSSWVSSLVSLKATTWAADTDTLPSSAPEAKVTIVSAGKEYSVSIYKLADAEDPRYICSSNTTPYLFYVSKYVAERYVKHVDDLIAK
jgi:hypothetical protein